MAQIVLDPWISSMMPGLNVIDKGFRKMKNILAGVEKEKLTPVEFMELHTIVYDWTSRTENPSRMRHFLYFYHKECLEEYINKVTLPALRLMQGETQLRELSKRWKDYNKLAGWLETIFEILNRYGLQPSLSEVCLTCFRDHVYKEVETNVRAAVIKLIYQDREACREGKKFDRALLQDVLRLQTHLQTSIDSEDA